ncbi:MAG: DNA topoisomerase VI subunit B [archaeon]
MVQTKLTDVKKNGKLKAEELAEKQKEISISEFFTKNRHLLGFDNPRKALLTSVKEAVDNALDATEEMNILPELRVEIKATSPDRYAVIVEDNGPGIVKEQIPKIFAKLLYGSKFHRLKMSRGQQGIGISAAALYGQLTTGKPAKITSKIGKNAKAHYYELILNTKTNEPEILKESVEEWEKEHGTRIEIEMEGKYHKGKLSVDEYLQLTAISNPHATIIYKGPEAEPIEFPRATKELPIEAKEIKPHPYGIELGILIKMLKETRQNTLQGFLKHDFCRVSSKVANEIAQKAGLYEKARPSRIARQEADNLYQAIQTTKIMSPPTDCISPIGEDQMIKGLKKEIDAEFYAAVTRKPSVYRGNPFQIEAAIAYGGTLPGDDLAKVIRFANRVPLQHQAGGCAITKSVVQTAWRGYGLSQSRSSLPSGPVVIMVHMASVWVPFTSESKEAIASYPEIIKEVKMVLQECGRKLSSHVRKVKKTEHEQKRKKIFEMYIHEVVTALDKISKVDKEKLKKDLEKISMQRTVGDSDGK